jgi:hypothetical protein
MRALPNPVTQLANAFKAFRRRDAEARGEFVLGQGSIESGWIVSRAGTVPGRVLALSSTSADIAYGLAGAGHSVIHLSSVKDRKPTPGQRIGFAESGLSAKELQGRFDLVTAQLTGNDGTTENPSSLSYLIDVLADVNRQ